MNNPKFTLGIEVYDEYGEGHWAQAKYLVHGYDDVLWTDSLVSALNYLHGDLLKHAENVKEELKWIKINETY